ncbi:MAG: hypothetical protein SPK03_00980 [Alloprevotella sp.]|nr:hypothetical protein [Alloprevotella sp.]
MFSLKISANKAEGFDFSILQQVSAAAAKTSAVKASYMGVHEE